MSSQDLAALEEKLDRLVAGEDVDIEQPVAETETAEESASPQPQAESAQFAKLDAVLPDDPNIPESLRGKPLSALLEDRIAYVHQAHRAGQEKNEAMAKAAAYEAALQVAKTYRPAEPPAAPQPRKTVLDSAGVDPDTDLIQRPREFFDRYGNALGSEIKQELDGRLQQVVQPLQEQVQRLQSENLRVHAERLFETARQIANKREGRGEYSPEEWQEKAPDLAAYMMRNGLNPNDPQNFVAAAEYYEGRWTRQAQAAASAPAPAPVPNPPGGASRPAALGTGQAPKSVLNSQERKWLSELSSDFGLPMEKMEEHIAAKKGRR